MKDGSYSVEAALIMPGIVLIILTFLWFGFYMRDVIFTEVYGRNVALEWEKHVDRGQTAMKNELGECLWSSEVTFFKIYEYSDKVRISYKLIPNIGLLKISVDGEIIVLKREKASKKLIKWYVWIDEAKELFLTEE